MTWREVQERIVKAGYKPRQTPEQDKVRCYDLPGEVTAVIDQNDLDREIGAEEQEILEGALNG